MYHNSETFLRHFDELRQFLATCEAVQNAQIILKTLDEHAGLKNELTALVFSGKVAHMFWNTQRALLEPSSFSESLSKLVSSVNILSRNSGNVLSELSEKLESSELVNLSLSIESDPEKAEVTRLVTLAGLSKLCSLMRASELKNLDANWIMRRFRPSNVQVESSFGLLKTRFEFII